VNQVISKRMVKKQQMRWTKRGAHRLLQVRAQVLNEDLRPTFNRCFWQVRRHHGQVMPHTLIDALIARIACFSSASPRAWTHTRGRRRG